MRCAPAALVPGIFLGCTLVRLRLKDQCPFARGGGAFSREIGSSGNLNIVTGLVYIITEFCILGSSTKKKICMHAWSAHGIEIVGFIQASGCLFQ